MDDVDEIRKLKARYFRGLDSKDWALYESVFAEDVVVDLSTAGGQRFEGREAFMAYAKAMPLVQSVHQGHMPEIELTGETTAEGVWALEDYNLWEDGSQNHGWGHYVETYEKVGGRWRIKTTRLSYQRMESVTEPPLMVAGAEGTRHLHGLRPASR